MKNNLLSITIGTPGRIRRLQYTLYSLLKQNLGNTEIIIGTDGNKDITEKAIKPFKKLLNINHIWLDNKPVYRFPKIYNKCIKYASGKYCLSLSDDLILPPYIINVLLKKIIKYGDTNYIAPLRKEIVMEKVSKNIILNNFNKIDKNSEIMQNLGVDWYCTPDSGVIMKREKALLVGGEIDYISGIGVIGEYIIRLRLEAGIKPLNDKSINIYHLAHKYRKYFGHKHIIQYVFRGLAKEQVPRQYIKDYLKEHPEFIPEMLSKAKQYKQWEPNHYENMIRHGRYKANEIALQYYKDKSKKCIK